MKNKRYQKPSFRVVKLHYRPRLLDASQSDDSYIPGVAPEEQNKLA